MRNTFITLSVVLLVLAGAGSTPAQTDRKATTTIVSSNRNPSPFGQLLTFTAQVNGNGGSPSGSVKFTDGDKTIGGGTLDDSGLAHLSIPWIPSGIHPVTAIYEGDKNFAASKSSTMRQVIKRAPTYVALTSSQEQSVEGQPVTLRATVSSPAATPTGAIEFKDGAKSLGTVPLNEFLQATLTTAKLSSGIHMVTAEYSGNEDFAVSRSKVLKQSVGQLSGSAAGNHLVHK